MAEVITTDVLVSAGRGIASATGQRVQLSPGALYYRSLPVPCGQFRSDGALYGY